MGKKRKYRNEIVEGMLPPLILAGGGMGASVLGGATSSMLPAGISSPLTTTGSVMGRFVAPVSVISAGGIVLGQLNKTQKKMKRRKY